MKKGFTLLELLVAVAVFAVIAASVYTSLYLGIKAWKMEENSDNGLSQAIITLDTVALRLRCAFLNPQNEEIKFIGQNDKVDLYSINADGDLENVIFYLKPEEDSELFSLVMSKDKFRHKEGDSPVDETVNKRVKVFKLEYFSSKQNKWFEDWPQELMLPQQVKVEIGIAAGKNGQEQFNLVKYVHIPAGKMNLAENE